jgi:uncharacterized protein
MPERDGYIPGVPCWVDLSEPDPEAAADFYRGLFGWEFEEATSSSPEGRYLIARGEAGGSSLFDLSGEKHDGDVAAIRSMPDGAPPGAMWNTYFWVDSADEAASKAHDAGGTVVREPFDFLDACRTAVLTDPEGAAFGVWEAREHRGAQLVNDPGAVVFNSLNTRDPEGARSLKATELGGTVIVPPFDAPWSTSTYTIRVAVLGDPQGATFSASKFLAKGDLASGAEAAVDSG